MTSWTSCLPLTGVSRLAGSQAGVALSRLFSVARLGSAAKVIKERRAVHSGVVCISVCLCACVLLGRESRRTREDRYSWHFFQSPLCDPHRRVSERLVVGTVSHGGFTANCVSLGQLAIQWEGVVMGSLELRGKPSYLSTFSLCSSTQAHCLGGVWWDEEPDHWEE